jgi:protoporphyrinogen oxidase
MAKQDIQSPKGTVVILGAGPTGLACAYEMLTNKAYEQVIILDRAKVPGGAGASFKWKEHTLDYGPHAFHTRGDKPEQLIRELFKDKPDILIEGRKKVRVFLRGKFYKYPLQVKEAFLKFNPFMSIKILYEFGMTMVLHRLISIPINSFEDWGRKRFGSTLYRLSFGDYTKKVWKTDPNVISRKFASEKIQGFSFINLIRKLFKIGGQVTEPYYQTWLYHRNGSGALFNELATQIQQLGGQIELEADVKSLTVNGRKIQTIHYQKNGAMHELNPDMVINTIQLPSFIRLFGDQAPFIVRHHANKLRYVSLVLVFIEFNVELIGNDNWFYLLDPGFAFNRVTEQKNLSPFTMEKGKTVLSFELTCRQGDDYWNMPDKELFELALADCRLVPQLKQNIANVSDFTVRRAPNVYEIYYKQFDAHAEITLGYVQEMENAVSIGRRGLFLQGDMHQSVEMGLNMGGLLQQPLDSLPDIKATYVKKYARFLDHY